MSNRTIQPTERQRAQLAQLQKNFGLSADEIERCLFFSKDQERPYIPPDLLIGIARATGQFQSIEPEYNTYVHSLEQIIYRATVVDQDGRSITRVGVATIGEKPGGIEMDPHKLAEGRALNSALADAGFNPFKSGFLGATIVATVSESFRHPSGSMEKEEAFELIHKRLAAEDKLRQITDDVERRRKDLGQMVIVAKRKGLIFRDNNGNEDKSEYRKWLKHHFGTESAAVLGPEERQQVINKLNLYEKDDSFLMNIPVELHADALIA